MAGLDARALAGRALLGGSLAYVLLVNLTLIVTSLVAPSPPDPWEAGQAIEAWRLRSGLPVYEDPDLGHATHMYGPLATVGVAALQPLLGLDLAGPVLSLVSSLLLVMVLLAATRQGASRTHLWVCLALFVGIHHRSGEYFTASRPDMPAVLLGLSSLLLLRRACATGSPRLLTGGIALLVVGCLFKQTVAMVAAVPPLALALQHERRSWRDGLLHFAPLIGLLVVALVMRVVWPITYYYVFDVPRQYSISFAGVAHGLWALALHSPLALMLAWLQAAAGEHEEPWLLASLLVAIPASAVTFAKVGGSQNSWIPALVAIAVYSARRLGPVLTGLSRGDGGWGSSLVAPAFLGALLVLSALPRPLLRIGPWRAGGAATQEDYQATVSHVRQLSGVVVSPQDPTLVLRAGRTPGRNLYLELDARGWPAGPPAPVLEELGGADHVVTVPPPPGVRDVLTPALLGAHGLKLISSRGGYSIWSREPGRAQ